MGLTYDPTTGRPYAARNAKLWSILVGDWATFIPATSPRRALFDGLDSLVAKSGADPTNLRIHVRVATRAEVESYVQRHPGAFHPETIAKLLPPLEATPQ